MKDEEVFKTNFFSRDNIESCYKNCKEEVEAEEMLIGYHISPRKNRESILATGLRRGKSGLDGAGVYLWKGPEEQFVKEADMSLSDSHYEMQDSELLEFYKTLDAFEVKYSKSTPILQEWPEYLVLDVNNVKDVTLIGDFNTVLMKYCN